MPSEYEHKKGIVFKNQFHVIFCPKYRRPVLVDGVDDRLKEIFQQKAEELEVKIVSMEVMPDHVHLFLLSLTVKNGEKPCPARALACFSTVRKLL